MKLRRTPSTYLTDEKKNVNRNEQRRSDRPMEKMWIMWNLNDVYAKYVFIGKY